MEALEVASEGGEGSSGQSHDKTKFVCYLNDLFV